jgi:uncharacterized protein YrrD
VVSADRGEKLGNVADLLLDQAGEHAIGLVVGSGWLGGEAVLPIGDIGAVGRDAVVARARENLIDAAAWRQRHVTTMRASTLRNKRVMTVTGRELGTVADVHVDEKSGDVQGIEIAGRSLLARRSVIPRSDGVRMGRDAVVLSQDAASQWEAKSGSKRKRRTG